MSDASSIPPDARDQLERLFTEARPKLTRMVSCRMDPRLASRVDADDVLQEAWVTAVRRIDEFDATDPMRGFVWLRGLAAQTLVDLHRRHIQAEMRGAGREMPIAQHGLRANSQTMSVLLAASLTSPSGAAMRAETHAQLALALDAMDEIDREIVTLRNFEELTNREVAVILGMTRSTASYRYIRALAHLKRCLETDR